MLSKSLTLSLLVATCHLLITLANSLDPGQAKLESKLFDTDGIPERIFWKKLMQMTKIIMMKNFLVN